MTRNCLINGYITYPNIQSNAAAICVRVVASNSIRVNTLLRHDGHVNIVGSGPT